MIVSDWAGPRADDRWRTQFTLLDRRPERAAIDRILDAVRSGFSGTLVLRGGPGVGKSTLLQYAVAAAPDLQVCGIAGVESEISMAFGGACTSCWSHARRSWTSCRLRSGAR
jgi:hypothetical protein